MTAVHAHHHQIQSGSLPNRYARGWHCLGLAQEYADGRPHSIQAFGTKIVVFQSSDGEFHALDGYCPHMGADLGIGQLEDKHLTCTFHHWKWGVDGVCKEIPYSKRIPPKAKIKVWPVCTQNHLLFVWHDPEGNAPSAEMSIPRINACFSNNWSPWKIVSWNINTNVRELVDNLADFAHFGPVHGQKVDYFANVFDGHVAYQMAKGGHKTLSDGELIADNAYFGPAYHITRLEAVVGDMTINSILLNCHVPIDQNSFVLRFGVMVENNPALSEADNEALISGYIEQAQNAFRQDVAIWDTKKRVDNPLLCAGDGPVYQLREWYSQFYKDVSDVQPTPLKAFEWESQDGVWKARDFVPLKATSHLGMI